MDTITYNLDTPKATIKGRGRSRGDGWLVGGSVKKMPDNTFNIEHDLKYTTCDQTDHPLLRMTQGKGDSREKLVTGPASTWSWRTCRSISSTCRGFFRINMGPKSGLLMPTYGGDLQGILPPATQAATSRWANMPTGAPRQFYTLGSWASGRLALHQAIQVQRQLQRGVLERKDRRKGRTDPIKQNNFHVRWTHSQDAKTSDRPSRPR